MSRLIAHLSDDAGNGLRVLCLSGNIKYFMLCLCVDFVLRDSIVPFPPLSLSFDPLSFILSFRVSTSLFLPFLPFFSSSFFYLFSPVLSSPSFLSSLLFFRPAFFLFLFPSHFISIFSSSFLSLPPIFPVSLPVSITLACTPFVFRINSINVCKLTTTSRG